MIYNINAYYLARGINLNKIEKKRGGIWRLQTKTRTCLVFEVEPERPIFLYFFGVVIFINLEKKTERKIIKSIEKFLINPVPENEIPSEEYKVVEDENLIKDTVEFEQVKIKKFDLNRREIIANILAQSVAIDYFENLIDQISLKFEEINSVLEKRGNLKIKGRQVIKLIGFNNTILSFILSKLSLLDKPDILWEREDLESLFKNLRSMFELDDRFKNLEIKINFIQENSKLMLQTLNNRRAEMLELTIIVLILIEVILFIYEIFLK
ncbi:hypothetical protein COS93_00665 [bacterium (Candidatus Gribaldobacteria) CG07_land_8_20_14_0_80_33_18]|uniref:DUF155 domain-containing protein n=1 Tax=bacterium (Candidatus Gribaldobacteria) CG07_land_8_20_14_0_80_33_18 TaxID=2014272 RepID=A0A2M6Z4B5_9BACT|nr:MAG: hypothetical protein COU04_00320 [bacterium (Candidatus Gribaldobacteria) CG10_big_fil_rev_8_21_14_0_10_33_41]PIU47147.1 MAG: hypothetical protein COS93_00665 [bacterium (Candidatus Gribaldobacteria) CG07_land_8_20_14_0_80_33_18]PJA01262.1 MAG: hypothetical protein COX75_00270 [bacterium (Candidatus Gribaldobacteria) CG_4_10_14_0_2_um_filter_33_15]PJB09007.1 MAG: hypothetical protein CO122_00400 [bacterium (Candidatus Gribaldobacteria) CG_4_9_14_3_um_filter_33_9]